MGPIFVPSPSQVITPKSSHGYKAGKLSQFNQSRPGLWFSPPNEAEKYIWIMKFDRFVRNN